MAKPNHLLKRGSQYYVRVRIPTALQEHYAPAKEIVRSLRTSDYADACLKVRSTALEIHNEFDRLKKAAQTKLTGITPEEAQKLADLWFAHLLEEDEELRLDGLSEHKFNQLKETQDIVSDLLKNQMARGHWNDEGHLFEMDDFAESHGFYLDKDSPEYKALAVSFLKASLKAIVLTGERNKGEIVETPKPSSVHPSGASSGIPLLSELIRRFLALECHA